MNKLNEREYLKIYNFGVGKVGIQSGRVVLSDKKTDEEKDRFPFIDLSILNNAEEIGKDLGYETESKDFVKLMFINIEGLEVFERALNFCRKELELKMDNPTE